MTEKMDKKSIEALVNYRLQRSSDTMQEANVLFREKHYNTTINRLYYACYYAVSALLLKNGITAHTHNGAKTMLGLHFVVTEKLAIKTANTYNTLFEKRQSGDYDDFIYFDEETTLELFEKSKEFIQKIQSLINNHTL